MKVWPSYYFFILVSVLISGQWNFPHLLKYLFFYQNYTGESSHIWSLCIEEHFYILLPFLFLSVLYLIPVQHRIKALFVFVSFVIISGILFKIISYSFTKSQDTYSATHNRIDALAWGVLLALLLNYSQLNFRNTYFKIIALASGFLILTAAISIEINTRWILFDKICFHSILPFAIFLILAGSYHINFSRIVVVRYIAYYSYNLYLWHLIVQRIIVNTYGDGIISLILDIIIGFFIAVLVTILIEEPCKNYFLYSNHEPTTPS